MIISCSSDNGMTLSKALDLSIHKKEISVSDSTEGEAVLNNQLRLWKELFTQSIDPYYHSPKWPNHCLESNRIGTPTKTANGITVISSFWLNTAGEVGFCSDSPKAIHAQVVMLYCKNESKVYFLKIPQDKELDLSKGIECP